MGNAISLLQVTINEERDLSTTVGISCDSLHNKTDDVKFHRSRKFEFNPFKPNLINWTNPFLLFPFDPNFDRLFCKQVAQTLIRRRVLWRLIWLCTVCQCPTKRALGLYWLTMCFGCSKSHLIESVLLSSQNI